MLVGRSWVDWFRVILLGVMATLACSLNRVTFALAEPGPTISKLMNREVTEFSFGMYRLRQYLSDLHSHDIETLDPGIKFVIPLYDWDKNRIELIFGNGEGLDPKYVEEKCKAIVDFVRRREVETPRKQNIPHSFIANLFFPEGYSLSGDVAEKVEIDKIMVIIYQSAGGRCEAPLLGQGVSILKN